MLNKYPFLKDLNKEQLKAATSISGPVLILAGAGSGKTKTIISRTALLIASKKANPENILVMTFTNKAAREMKERGIKILSSFNQWSGITPNFTTFHSWGITFIKSLSLETLSSVGLHEKFSIADTSDQCSILNKFKYRVFPENIANNFKADKFLLTLGKIQNKLIPFSNIEETYQLISNLANNEELDLSMFIEENEGLYRSIASLYILYKEELRLNNSVDFDDLINIPIKILELNNNIKSEIHKKYKYIMVDEFQDTNSAQLKLLEAITNSNNNICVVGDDSQSIYGWRGADISYILNFHKKHKECKNINLSINYRSSKIIVKKANKLLKNAEERHENKAELIAFKEKKGIVQAKFFKNAKEEAKSIASGLNFLISRKGVNPGDIAILFRTAFIIGDLELELVNLGIPYKIHRGKTLLERKVSKAFISYLKLIENENNNIALVNVLLSSKIITEKRASEFSIKAEEENLTLLNYLKSGKYKLFPRLSKPTINKIDSFLDQLEYFIDLSKGDFKTFYTIFCRANYIKEVYEDIIEKNMTEKVPESRLNEANSNLTILSMISRLGLKYNTLNQLLEIISLEGEEEDCEDTKVNLMTIHASKGLEFEVVFLMGASNGVFPSPKCVTNKQMEEERRLFYVAITRAKHMLRISGASIYFRNNNNSILTPSRFINESKIEIT